MAIQAQLYNSENNGLLNGSQNSCWIDNNGCDGGGGLGGGGGSAAGNGGYNQFCYDFQLQKTHELQQKQQLQQQQQNQQQSMFLQNHSHILKNNINGGYRSISTNQSIAGYIEKQKQEIDQFLRNQNEKLVLFLQEQKKQQFAMICRKIDEKASLLLKQKDEELAKAANRTMELENLLRKLEMENQAWQRTATENEAMVVSLSNSLEQLMERISQEGLNNNNGGVEDAESICEENMVEEEEEEEAETGENRGGGVSEGIMMPLCKGCNSRNSCVLFLPCRHLCSCMACEAFLDSCPVCTTIKRSSILVLT